MTMEEGAAALTPEQAGGYEVAYNEAVRALSQQQATLEAFQTRAGILLSSASLATSFFGGQALKRGAPSVWTWVAIGLFVATAVATLRLLRERKATQGFGGFVASPSLLIDAYLERDDGGPPLPLWQVHRELSLRLEQTYEEIQPQVHRLARNFELALVLLTATIGAWVLNLATG